MTTTATHRRPAPAGRLLGALASSILGLGLLLGVPIVLLSTVGVPWAQGWAELDGVVAEARTGVVDPDAVVAGLSLIVWLAWARVAVALVLDAMARLAHRPPPEARVLGGSQRLAAAIVTSAAILVSMLARVSSARGATVTVETGDTLSGIAGRVYGDENAWRPIFEANAGRSFAGRVFDDPNLILPGWQLDIPESATPTPDPGVAPPESLPATTVVAVVTPDSPAMPAPATNPVSTTVPVEAPLGASSASSGPACTAGVATTGERDGMPTGLAGAVLLAGGALTAVELHRRRATRAGVRLPAPTASTAATETVLRRVDAGERVARLDVALRAAAVCLRGRAVSVLVVLDRADGRVLLQLSGPAEAVAPFEPVTPDRWMLPGRVDVVELAPTARGAAVPCPTLVHLGHGPDGDVYVDLEGVGTLAIDGPREVAAGIVRAVAGSLGVSPLADVVTVVTVGAGLRLGGPRVIEASDVDAAIELVAPVVGATAAATAAGSTTFALRGRTPDEAWDPAVLVVAPEAAGDDGVAELTALTTPPGRGLGVVVGGPLRHAGAVLSGDQHRWTLQPFGLALTPTGISDDEVSSVRELLARTSTPHASAPAQDEVIVLRPVGQEPEVGPFVEAPVAVMVRLLGPLRIEDSEGEEVPVEKGKALELVAWLALHRDHPSRSSARAALWDVEVRDATFANVVSEARRSLARSVRPPDGEEWIARTLSDRLPLHRLVVTDADLVRARVAHARRQDPARAVETLRPVLELIRDVPLLGGDATWADAEGHTTDLTMLATTAAQELAERCLDVDDVEGALAATAVGLRVLPGHEALVGLRMRARAAAGDPAGVRAEWEAYGRVVAADPWAGGTPAPELVALRRQLLAPLPT